MHKASINLLIQLIRGGNLRSLPNTVAKFLNKRKIDGKFVPGPKNLMPINGVAIIDESSMVDNIDYNDILKLAKDKNSTVIFMGDPAQLPPVASNILSPALTYTEENEGVELTEVMRQKETNPVLNLVTAIRSNLLKITESFSFDSNLNDKNEGNEFIKDKTKFMDKINELFSSDEYKKDPTYAKIVTYSNNSVYNYNQTIFAKMNIDQPYGVGSVLMGYEQSTPEPVVHNGQDYKVVENEYKDEEDSNLLSANIQGTIYQIKGKISGWNVKIKRIFNEEDTALIESSEATKALLNSQEVFIINPYDDNNIDIMMQFLRFKEVTSDNSIPWRSRSDASERLDRLFSKYQFPEDLIMFEGKPTTLSMLKNKRPDLFKLQENGKTKFEELNIKAFYNKNIDYGYAVTSHKAQGSTYRNVFVDYQNMDNPFNNRIINYNGAPYGNERNMLKYVALSRTSGVNYIYTSKATNNIFKSEENNVPLTSEDDIILDTLGEDTRDSLITKMKEIFYSKKEFFNENGITNESQIEKLTETQLGELLIKFCK